MHTTARSAPSRKKMYVGILSPVESVMSLFSSHAFLKGLGAIEISVGHGMLGFHYQNWHWFSLLPTFLPLLVVPPVCKAF